jgi:site-specific recombinase XerD
MQNSALRLVSRANLVQGINSSVPAAIPSEEQLADHQAILEGYLDTHITRGHMENTRKCDRFYLTRWFQIYSIPDATLPAGVRQLFVWEAMAPITGRERAVEYGKDLMRSGLERPTVASHMLRLRRLFAYVLEQDYIPGTGQIITAKYGPIVQPISEYDYPKHVTDPRADRIVLTREQLSLFLAFIREHYIPNSQKVLTAWRDYTMFVLAVETGLRASELCHLDCQGPHRDLLYSENRVQTRFGKATNGSGKRTRQTVFTLEAQQVVRAYEKQIRPHFRNAQTHPALFLTETGDRMTYNAAYQQLKKIVRAAQEMGLDIPSELGMHDFRRRFATNFIESHSGDLPVLLNLMGHQNASTIGHYAQPSEQYCNRIKDQYIHEVCGDTAA